MDISIIIVSWRVKDFLKSCLESIYKEISQLDFEVIVIDNDSGDGTVEMVKENFPQVKLTSSQLNLGFAKANNLGLRQARGQYILFLNPDTKFIDDSLIKAINYYKANPDIGALGCQLLNHDLTIQASVRCFPRFIDHLLMIFKLHHFLTFKKYLAKDFDYTKTQKVEQVMGAFFLMSRQAIKQVGNWDESYYLWFDEVDYCQRIKKSGLKTIYFHQTQIIHYGNQSFKQISPVLNIQKQWHFSKTRLRYILKHQNILVYLIILILTPVSLLLSLIPPKNVK